MQLAPGASEPPAKVKPSLLPFAVTAPPQVLAGAPLISRPKPALGSPSIWASTRAAAGSKLRVVTGLALLSVMIRLACWPAATVPGLNALVMPSAERTDSEAVAF